MKDATEAEQWLDNFSLMLEGFTASDGSRTYYPACDDAFVPGELDKFVAEKVAKALELAALHVETQRVLGDMPTSVSARMIAKTLRSDDFARLVKESG